MTRRRRRSSARADGAHEPYRAVLRAPAATSRAPRVHRRARAGSTRESAGAGQPARFTGTACSSRATLAEPLRLCYSIAPRNRQRDRRRRAAGRRAPAARRLRSDARPARCPPGSRAPYRRASTRSRGTAGSGRTPTGRKSGASSSCVRALGRRRAALAADFAPDAEVAEVLDDVPHARRRSRPSRSARTSSRWRRSRPTSSRSRCCSGRPAWPRRCASCRSSKPRAISRAAGDVIDRLLSLPWYRDRVIEAGAGRR